MGSMNIGGKSSGPVRLGDVKIPDKFYNRFKTGYAPLDDLFGGGGFIPGSVITVSAMRGAGKTTALLQILEGFAVNSNKKVLYLSGEEYTEQLAFTAERINSQNVMADYVTDVDKICENTKDFDVIVIDSLQATTAKSLRSRKSIDEYAINSIYKAANENDCTVFIILHARKDGKGSIGSSAINHTVDCVVQLYNMDEEENGEGAKLLEIQKNRFGAIGHTRFRMGAMGFDFHNSF